MMNKELTCGECKYLKLNQKLSTDGTCLKLTETAKEFVIKRHVSFEICDKFKQLEDE